ncbi:MAG: protein kinase domain-containing protein [Acidobacteriota bacterium]
MLGRKLGRYQILQGIGAGGMGEVYRARDEHLERDVALKVLPPGAVGDEQARRRFRKEALALSRLNHPNIATVHDFSTEADLDFLVMEYVEGDTLSAKLARGPLAEREIIQLGVQIAEGLTTAHQQGVVHRDIKPDNVRMTSDGRVKILDFGLAQLVRHADHAIAAETVSQTQATGGTFPYMAPEQLRGTEVDPRTDIHAVGAVLYEMATGQRPYREQLIARLVEAILHQAPEPPSALNPRISAELERIVLKCLEKDPENRYQSAKELAVDLRRLGTPSVSASVVSAAPRRRPANLWVGVGVAAAVLLAALVAMNVDRLNPRPARPAAERLNTVVILPSQVFAADTDGFLADAIPSLLSTYLAQVQGLEVKAPPTSADFERVGSDMDKVVNAYKVDGLVLSSVSAQADRLMLDVQLVDAATRRLIWSQQFAQGRQYHMDLVRMAADALRATLRPDAAPPSGALVGTSSPDTELLLQRGRYYARFYSYRKQNSDFDLALSAFERVLAQEPSSAAAAVGIAGLHIARIEAGAAMADVLAHVDRWTGRALEIDSRSGEAWRILSVAEEFRPNADRQTRIEYALKAAWLAPASAGAQHALGTVVGRHSLQLALAALGEATRLDPLQLNSSLAAAGALAILGRTAEGLPLVEDVLKIEPDIVVGQLVKSFLLLSDRRDVGAAEVLKRLEPHVAAARLQPGWFRFVQDWLAFETTQKTGDRPGAEAALKRLVALARGDGERFPQWQAVTLHVVLALARHGELEAAMDALDGRFDAGVAEPYDSLVQNPDLQRVRQDPRFQRIAARSRVQFESLAVALQEACERKECPRYLEKPLVDLLSLR